jgi:hypothetical protein
MGEAILELLLLAVEFIAWVIDMARRPVRLAEPSPPRSSAGPTLAARWSAPPSRSARQPNAATDGRRKHCD